MVSEGKIRRKGGGRKSIDMKDTNIYQKGIKISDEEMERINLKKDDFKGKWNYTITKEM